MPEFKAPFLSADEIRQKADQFRTQYGGDNVPVDIMSIIEFDLDFDIVPIKNLQNHFDTDAFLRGSVKEISVDYDCYMDERRQTRLRYSVAHEIGHYVLHGDLMLQYHEDLEDWLAFQRKVPEKEYSFLEYHAYEFAGRLLVPIAPLKESLASAVALCIDKGLPSDVIASGSGLEYISTHISKEFFVSKNVIEKRLEKEDLWPPHL